jgi:hypothetical protein
LNPSLFNIQRLTNIAIPSFLVYDCINTNSHLLSLARKTLVNSSNLMRPSKRMQQSTRSASSDARGGAATAFLEHFIPATSARRTSDAPRRTKAPPRGGASALARQPAAAVRTKVLRSTGVKSRPFDSAPQATLQHGAPGPITLPTIARPAAHACLSARPPGSSRGRTSRSGHFVPNYPAGQWIISEPRRLSASL